MGFYLVPLVGIFPGFGAWVGAVFSRLTSRPSETCHHQCLRAVCGVSGYPVGAAAELLHGTLKLRYCITSFSRRFSPWSLPRGGRWAGKRDGLATSVLLDECGNVSKRVRLTRKTCPGTPHCS